MRFINNHYIYFTSNEIHFIHTADVHRAIGHID